MHKSVQQAISFMYARHSEQITLDDLAAETFFSPFHFSRLFSKETGVPPGRYLTAIRLFEAKRLLTTTTLNVADIVTTVGYSSVGTFTTRFTRATGLSPTRYRSPEAGCLLAAVGPGFHRLPTEETARAAKQESPPVTGPTGSLTGTLELPPGVRPATVLVGVFDSRIPQGEPVACQLWAGTGPPSLAVANVPPGRWAVLAVAGCAAGATTPGGVIIGFSDRMVTVSAGRTSRVDVRLRRPHPTDPPIAMMVAPPLYRSLASRAQ